MVSSHIICSTNPEWLFSRYRMAFRLDVTFFLHIKHLISWMSSCFPCVPSPPAHEYTHPLFHNRHRIDSNRSSLPSKSASCAYPTLFALSRQPVFLVGREHFPLACATKRTISLTRASQNGWF